MTKERFLAVLIGLVTACSSSNVSQRVQTAADPFATKLQPAEELFPGVRRLSFQERGLFEPAKTS
jgi:hypothetical protein